MRRLRTMSVVFAALLALLSVLWAFETHAATSPATGEEQARRGQMGMIYSVPRSRLGHAVSPYEIYIDASICKGTYAGEKWLRVVIQRHTRLPLQGAPFWETQVRPYWYRWQLRDSSGNVTHERLAQFLENRDGTYHTVIKLPAEDLKRSFLQLYFEYADSDPNRDDVTYELDLRDYDWATESSNWVDQAVDAIRIDNRS